ncbi:MAG: amino acid adenylation domain-containing protein, partial [Gemmatimonadota bacterium]|nr:amino acid adenylation domain-containing protein [Gemmatimonadota bacterium]
VSFVPELLAPYQGNRMADGVHAGSLPIGDPNFHAHDSIDPALAEAWRRVKLARRLGGAARRLAQEIGYEVEVPNAAAASATVRDSRAPLSFSQQRLYFLEQLEPGAATYILPAVLRVKGTLELEALERSVRVILERHEVLRTMLVTHDGHPFQEVLALDEFALPIENLEDVPEETREEAVRQRVSELLHRPFELDRDLKLRAHLLRLEEREHLLVVAMHHIASDGSSVEIFLRELTALYEAFAAGNPSPLPALPFQYADFAERQRQQLQGTLLENQLAYWREQLADLPVLDLPTDRPRPPVQTHRGNSRSWVASAPLIDRLKRLSQQENVTPYMTLLAAFKLLLSRLSGQEVVVVGSPIAGRNQEGTERLIGFFLNNLVLRTDLSGDPSFSELLARVRETTLAAYANQEIPFEKLLAELKPPRDLSRTPLFQVMFNMVPGGGSERRRLGGAEVELVVGAEESKFDLTLYVADGEDTRFRLVYNPDLFDATSAERLLEHYRTLLEAIAAAPERRLSTLPKLREHRPAQLLPEGISPHSSFIEFPVQALDRSIAARFAEQVRARPDAVAVETDQHVWSYAELERRANQVAHALLRACGSGDDRIALLVEHDAPMLAAVLGVLKAGKSYVPLDPSFPAERLQRILEDAGPSALLAQASLAAVARRCAGELRVITIEEAWRTEPHQEPELEISPETAAYILYTSGSTGEPKGVVQSQRNVLHHIRTYTNRLRIASGDRLTLLSSYGFDAAVMDIFAALLNGATLCPIDLKSGVDGDLLGEVVRRGITIYHSTPTVYRHMAAQFAGGADLSRVRLVVLGGEEALPRDIEIFRSHFAPHARFVNGLGPTECTVALQYVVDHQGELPRRTVPVGYAVEGTEVVLLNEAGEPVEVYATGEITIRSAHLALGYWRRPELTRAAFLPDPQGGERRLYRTGDLGRLLPDGSIEFVGRRDAQVKIRGYRIETAEIESALLVHRAVDQVVVLPRRHENGGEGERQLAAYLVVPEGIAQPSQAELRELLRAKLPLYMVPSEYFFLGSLPLTANGKVDRRALLALEQPQPAAATTFAAPEAPLELLIAGIWRDLLEVEQIAVDDNFYDLGGHSLLALRFIARFQDATGIRINPRELT